MSVLTRLGPTEATQRQIRNILNKFRTDYGTRRSRAALSHNWNKPFTNAGFGNWFRDQCDAAGLPKCSAQGLRKAIMRRMAAIGLAQQDT